MLSEICYLFTDLLLYFHYCVFKLYKFLARAVGVPVGSQLAATLVATINDIIFSFLFGTSVRRYSGRRSGVAVRAVDCWQ